MTLSFSLLRFPCGEVLQPKLLLTSNNMILLKLNSLRVSFCHLIEQLPRDQGKEVEDGAGPPGAPWPLAFLAAGFPVLPVTFLSIRILSSTALPLQVQLSIFPLACLLTRTVPHSFSVQDFRALSRLPPLLSFILPISYPISSCQIPGKCIFSFSLGPSVMNLFQVSSTVFQSCCCLSGQVFPSHSILKCWKMLPALYSNLDLSTQKDFQYLFWPTEQSPNSLLCY